MSENLGSNRFTDSAGVPWEGREFSANKFEEDSGLAPAEFLKVMKDFREGLNSVLEVVDVIRSMRLLVPLVANLGESEVLESGLKVDKSAELSIVTVKSPDGQDALVAFSSVEAMAKWNKSARPVPSDAIRVTLAAAAQGATRVVIDPGSETEFVLRRPLIAKIAQEKNWQPVELDQRVSDAIQLSIKDEGQVLDFQLFSADPTFRLLGPELEVRLNLEKGMEPSSVRDLVDRVTKAWSESEAFAELVDSVAVKLVSS